MHCSRLLCVSVLVLSMASSIYVPDALSDAKKERGRTVKELVLDITRADIKSVYVPDFLETDGARTDRGALLAASFSKSLSEHARTFQVIDRSAVQRDYSASKPSVGDLQNLQSLVQIARHHGAEAILWGKVSRDAKSLDIDLSIIDCRDEKEIYRLHHREEVAPGYEGHFPATTDSSGRIFYFPGLDGVSMPKCIHCPDPSYTESARSNKVTGVVHLSVIITAQGTSEGVRVFKRLDPGLDQAALDAVRTWRFEPAKGPDHTPLPVRTVIEVSFQLR